jgi:hypothetical protein
MAGNAYVFPIPLPLGCATQQTFYTIRVVKTTPRRVVKTDRIEGAKNVQPRHNEWNEKEHIS